MGTSCHQQSIRGEGGGLKRVDCHLTAYEGAGDKVNFIVTKTNSCYPYPTPPAINNDKNPILPQISQSVYFFNYISFDFNS